MGITEAAVLIHSAGGYDKDKLLEALSAKTETDATRGGAIHLPKWYRLPDDERAAFLVGHQSPIYIVLDAHGEFADVSTDDDLFWPPVRQQTSDEVMRQYAELVQFIATVVNADVALQYKLGRSAPYKEPMREWLKGRTVIFEPTLTAYAVFGFSSKDGFRTFIQRQRPATPENE